MWVLAIAAYAAQPHSSLLGEEAQSGAMAMARAAQQLKAELAARARGPIDRYHKKIWSLLSASRPKEYIRGKGVKGEVSKVKLKPQKQQATFVFSEGLGNIKGVSLESVVLPGYYMHHKLPPSSKKVKKLKKRYPVSLKKEKQQEPTMSQMTFFVKPGLMQGKTAAKGWVSLEVVKNDEFKRPGWFLRELNGKLFVEHNDKSAGFAASATFKVVPSLWKVCPGKKAMCSGRGSCVDIKQAVGKCMCTKAFKGKACEQSVLKIKRFASSGKYDYFGSKGPAKWSTLDPKWKLCKTGRRQSPIPFKENLTLQQLVSNQFLSIHYQKSGYSIARKGKEVKVLFDAKKQYINAGGIEYDLSHMELHAPGEHAVPAKINPNCASGTCAYDMELQLVHTRRGKGKRKGKLGEAAQTCDSESKPKKSTMKKPKKPVAKKKLTTAQKVKKMLEKKEKAKAKKPKKQGTPTAKMVIISVPFKIGMWPNKLLTKLLRSMPKRDKTAKAKGSLQIFYDLPQNPTYYRYMGSLTKPPCTEGVLWYFFAQPLECTAGQVQKLYDTNSRNARPVQKLAERKVSSAFTMEELAEMSDVSLG
jgi:carbonic anhydrase